MNEHIYSRTETTGGAFDQRSKQGTLRGEFMRRQVSGEATLSQIIFDVTTGMILPILCLVLDPIVFRRTGFGGAVLGGYQFFAYGLIAIEIAALGVWLAAGKRAEEWCGVLAGMMLAGALFSAVIGIGLLPLSVIGLMFGIGVFGFTPLLTAFIYWRNARRALAAAVAQMGRAAVLITVSLGAVVPFGAPAFAHWRITRFVERTLPQVLNGDDAGAQEAAARKLGQIGWLVSGELDPLVWAYSNEADPARKERLARAYREITGDRIESRLNTVFD